MYGKTLTLLNDGRVCRSQSLNPLQCLLPICLQRKSLGLGQSNVQLIGKRIRIAIRNHLLWVHPGWKVHQLHWRKMAKLEVWNVFTWWIEGENEIKSPWWTVGAQGFVIVMAGLITTSTGAHGLVKLVSRIKHPNMRSLNSSFAELNTYLFRLDLSS